MKEPTRRSLFIKGLRRGALALMAVGGGAAWTKRRRLVREGKCINNGVCSGCLELPQCGLPLALSTKKHRKTGSTHDAE